MAFCGGFLGGTVGRPALLPSFSSLSGCEMTPISLWQRLLRVIEPVGGVLIKPVLLGWHCFWVAIPVFFCCGGTRNMAVVSLPVAGQTVGVRRPHAESTEHPGPVGLAVLLWSYGPPGRIFLAHLVKLKVIN